MPFTPTNNKEISIGQSYPEALAILEENKVDWIFQSRVNNLNKGKICSYDIGILKDFGIVELREEDGKVYLIKLHLNWFDNNQTFKGDSFSINAHYSFPNGQGEIYKACNIEVKDLFMTINEIQSKGHTAFPFLTPNLSFASDMFPEYVRQNTTAFINRKSQYNSESKMNIVEYFTSLLSNEHRNALGDLQGEMYETNYNSAIYKAWNDLNAANKKVLQKKQWNSLDTQFNNEVGYILRTYDELLYDDNHMKIVHNFINSELFSHKMECGLNITHIIGLVKYQPLHELIYNKFIALEEHKQKELLTTCDNTGLTLPLLHVHRYESLAHEESKIISLNLFKKYTKLPNFESLLLTEHAGLLDIVPTSICSEVLEIIETENIQLQPIYHVQNKLFNQYFRYQYKIEGQGNILSWLKETGTSNQSLAHEYRQKAAIFHNFWLNQKVNTVFDNNKNIQPIKKLKI